MVIAMLLRYREVHILPASREYLLVGLFLFKISEGASSLEESGMSILKNPQLQPPFHVNPKDPMQDPWGGCLMIATPT